MTMATGNTNLTNDLMSLSNMSKDTLVKGLVGNMKATMLKSDDTSIVIAIGSSLDFLTQVLLTSLQLYNVATLSIGMCLSFFFSLVSLAK